MCDVIIKKINTCPECGSENITEEQHWIDEDDNEIEIDDEAWTEVWCEECWCHFKYYVEVLESWDEEEDD